ncbi:peptidoglycan recognition protein family protein [Heyndrickxia vini]|uniref:peptidoglycan recognition protein family protein n=1 Tax=Heyndrickxia vini TaxID=1476025 RepID=UPI00192C17F0|nr:N-acetylmuramoyl-L-alanine amidase [Heyndrickxia vini]
MKINQKFIPVSNTFTRPGIKMDPEYITIHETDNTSRGADDVAHANLQYKGNTRQASWHFQVDEDSIYQSLPTNEVGWHAGDGYGLGNMKSIAIEICVNSDGDFKKAVDNTVWLTNHLMNEHSIPVSNVVQHNHWSGKNCPRYLRSGEKGITWEDFLDKVKAGASPSKPETNPNPTIPDPSNDSSFKGKRVESIYGGSDGVNFYSKATFDTNYKVGILRKGDGFPEVVQKVKVGNEYMYKVKNSKGAVYYITASPKYVKLEGASKNETHPGSASKPKPKKVYLPRTDSSWRVYPLDKAPVKGNEVGFLNPKKFGGLSYDILGEPQKDVYTIKTDDFGKVNIYAAPSTGAVIK